MAKKTRRKYTEEFKAEVVRFIVEEGHSISQAASNLDINANMLGKWKRGLTEDAEIRQQVADQKEELRRLGEKVRQLKMEREILKRPSWQRNRAEISIHQTAKKAYPVTLLCRVMEVSRSGSYRYMAITVRPRFDGDPELSADAKAVFEASLKTYGSSRMSQALPALGKRQLDHTLPTTG